MLKQEFEKLAGYEVSVEDYEKIIEPMYYATDMSKKAFIKTLNRKRFEVKRKPIEKAVFVSDGEKTPNGCYYMGTWMIQIGYPEVNIGTGKVTYKLRETTVDEQEEIGFDRWFAYNVDIDTENPRYVVKVVK